jgi:hypothetical protein
MCAIAGLVSRVRRLTTRESLATEASKVQKSKRLL